MNPKVAAIVSTWSPVILVIATLGIAIATLLYAFATRRLVMTTKEGIRAQIVSSTRLAWMDSVRDAVAEFLSLDAELKDERAIKLGTEFVDNLMQRRLMIRHRVAFRLDPEKPLHKELLLAIDDLMSGGSNSELAASQTSALTIQIMEKEWRRVRREVGAPVSADALGKSVEWVSPKPGRNPD